MVSVFEASFDLSYLNSRAAAIYSVPTLQAFAMLIAAKLMKMERLRGEQTSGPLFTFFLTMVASSAISVARVARNFTKNSENIAMLTLLSSKTMLFLIVTILSCLSDLPQDEEPEKKNEAEEFDLERPEEAFYGHNLPRCPEQDSSFPSRISFHWLTPFVRRGYKKSITVKDMFRLPPSLEPSHVIRKFDENYIRHYRRKGRPIYVVKIPEIIPAFMIDKNGDPMAFKFLPKPAEAQSTSRKSISASAQPENKKRRRQDMNETERQEYDRNKKEQDEWAKQRIRGLPTVLRTFWVPFTIAGIVKLMQDLLMFASPYLQMRIINFMTSDEPLWKGYLYAIAMPAVAVIQTFTLHAYYHKVLRVGMEIRTSITCTIYRKEYFYSKGIVMLAGVAVMMAVMFANAGIAVYLKKKHLQLMSKKDDRVKMMNEILNGIKVLKLYAWETSFLNIVEEIRRQEVRTLYSMSVIQAVSNFLSIFSPYAVSLVTFGLYVMVEQRSLNASTIFVSLTLFDMLRMPLSTIPAVLMYIVQVQVAQNRIDNFLNAEELQLDATIRDHDSNAVTTNVVPPFLQMQNFQWILKTEISPGSKDSLCSKKSTYGLAKANFAPLWGKLARENPPFCQPWLEKCLAFLDLFTFRQGTVAYVPQTAWMQNASIRNNVLFGKSFNAAWYWRVLKACEILPDLDILPARDFTEIGEKGINLSGGQKQRVNLARAVYNQADIYLLDDPLSAVDPHVAHELFKEVIGPQGLLATKTRILVTHHLPFLFQADEIIVLRQGRIIDQGKMTDLIKHGYEELQQSFLPTESESEKTKAKEEIKSEEKESKDPEDISSDYKAVHGTDEHRIILAEKTETGRVRHTVYKYYFACIGWIIFFAMVFLFVIAEIIKTLSRFWLAWNSRNAKSNDDTNFNKLDNSSFDSAAFLAIYAAFGAAYAIAFFFALLLLFLGGLRASIKMHGHMAEKIFRCPNSFFETTPIGRVLNRFGKDLDVCDTMLPELIRGFLVCATIVSFLLLYVYFFKRSKTYFMDELKFDRQVIGTIIAIAYSTPLVLIIVAPLGVSYWVVQQYYVTTSRQLKRMESVSRSPMFSHFSETLNGASTIRAYQQQGTFVQQMFRKISYNQATFYPYICANSGFTAVRWLALRLEAVGNLFILGTTILCVLGKGSLDPGMVGLSLNYALAALTALGWLVRITCEIETNIVSVERIKEYSEMPSEALWVIPENRPPPDWPSRGQIEFVDYKTRYRPRLGLTLHGISMVIQPGEKAKLFSQIHSKKSIIQIPLDREGTEITGKFPFLLLQFLSWSLEVRQSKNTPLQKFLHDFASQQVGIVGRTGAGKSSLTMALFRIVEAVEGKILIDDIDIATIGLHDLRKRLSIIPQDPVLFSGSLRMNLDPFEEHTDEALWKVLELCHLKDHVQAKMRQGLMHHIEEGGENLSLGQRQMVCLARALLRSTKILILDEATAAVDLGTDELIQKTIRSAFTSYTVLTIAHRMKTIMDSDKVLVLSKGRILEFAPPQELLANENSEFYAMAVDAQLVPGRQS
ncbi:unnamed protein product [Notodromas monacha]|uniref:Uncharacterized protein n=1 Tax=Notodromas monacha TaxID=399045 RepID=A0A7R9BQZ5_9CRUS|nr:unnamed protein product [Notodromas monacha]CAG0919744.1 unnamed protein product [Notodromas monacha]